MHIRDQPGVLIAVFDQCMMGLVSKVEKKPYEKENPGDDKFTLTIQ